MEIKKEEIKQWINDVYTKLWALLSLYGETDGFKIVPEGETEENPQDFISRRISEIRRIEQNFSLYMNEQEIAEVKKLKPRLIAIDLETAIMAIDPEVREISDKLADIINDTVYFFNRHFNQQAISRNVVFWWGAINPHLIYFERVFDLMEKSMRFV